MPPRGVQKGTKNPRQSKSRAKGQTKEQLYIRAKRLKIDGRSSMNKSQLQRAIAARSR